MICNYENITDYCLNKFTYQYAAVPTATSGDMTTSVIRTDKDSGEIVTIDPNTDLYILPCDINDLVEVISAWECYQIFINNSNTKAQNVDIDKIIDASSNSISTNYDLSLSDGGSINIQNMNTILLDGSINNQIHLGNIAALSILLYNLDPQSPMPYILDVNNIAYYLNYNDLQYLLTEYFNQVSKQKNIKDDALVTLDTTTLITNSSLNNSLFCKNQIPDNVKKSNITIDYSNIQNVVLSLPPEICDPPCDPNSCESCVNGNCENLCAEGQYCCDGACQDEPCLPDGICPDAILGTPNYDYELVSCPDGWWPGLDPYCCPPGYYNFTTGDDSTEWCCPEP